MGIVRTRFLASFRKLMTKSSQMLMDNQGNKIYYELSLILNIVVDR